VRVRVLQGARTLWDFIVVRPQASSGTNGSGVELRYVDHLGQRVLSRAHVPILNVQYGSAGVEAGCGPTYRDWQNSEACFQADGNEPVGPGWRVCQAPPATILESGHDGGNFRGVALWYHAGDLRIVSQLQAGWYRYISDWHLLDNGTIRPRFGFAATANPCTCKAHTHHAYWRFDFDILSAGDNIVEEYNNPPVVPNTNWHTKVYEIRRARDASRQRRWRVRRNGTFTGYNIVPGPNDGTADAYGAGDLWVLRYHGNELDDGHGFTTNPVQSRADIDKFVNGERVDGADVVLWYAGHFLHDEAHPTTGGHVVGPELTPFNW
jgi:copper amine oxidase-like protein